MVMTLLVVYNVIPGFMTLTLFQGHRCVRNINCKLLVLDSCPLQFKHCMVATYIRKNMHDMICVTLVLYSGEVINMCLVSRVSGLVKNISTGIFSDTINAINVKLCMVVLLI